MSAVPTVVAVAKTSVEEAVAVRRTVPLLSASRVPTCLVATLVSQTQDTCYETRAADTLCTKPCTSRNFLPRTLLTSRAFDSLTVM